MADLSGGPPSRPSPNRRAEVVLLAIGAVLVLAVVLVGVVRLGGGDSDQATTESPDEDQVEAGETGPATGPAVLGYFPSGSAYEEETDYDLADLVESGAAERLTGLVYAYGAVVENGECTSADPWADYQWPIPADRSVDGQADAEDQPLAGHLNQLRKLKERFPDLTVRLALGSEGGARPEFAAVAATAESREEFVANCVDTFLRGDLPVLADNPQGGAGVAEGIFDGIDIHWQWPEPADRANHAALLAEFRRQLDTYAEEVGRQFTLGTFLPAFLSSIEDGFDVPEVFAHVDHAAVEGYYYYAPWNDDNLITNHHAQLYNPPDNPYAQWGYEQSLDGGVQMLIDAGAPADRLVATVPAFGPGWSGVPGTDDGLWQDATGGEVFYTYDEIIDAPGTAFVDEEAVAAYRYDGDVWYSYDTPETVAVKAEYVREHSLGGIGIWPLGGDRAGDLLTAAAQVRG